MTTSPPLAKGAARATAAWNPERGPASARNGFGRQGREAGHSRSPEPPHRITG